MILHWLDAHSMPVESLDFGLLIGDVVPRDGLKRPLLTSGSPTHTPVPRRANKQPINVTHVHQTVVQHFRASGCCMPSHCSRGHVRAFLLRERPFCSAGFCLQACF